MSWRSLATLLVALSAAALAACHRSDGASTGTVTDASVVMVTPVAAPPDGAASDATHPALRAERFSEAGMLAEAALYLDDADFRRRTLVESLVNPKNTYSKQRLDAYGLKTAGWDLLPVWNPQSVPATSATAADLRAHRSLAIDPAAPRLWDGKRPTTMAGWVALGREVFFGYPLRVEIFVSWALEHPDVGERVGVRAATDGTYPGVRIFTDIQGRTALGITCAICHASIDEHGRTTVGEARRVFDYGALRNAYHAQTGVRVDADLARRMKSWGPGRADVTEDDDEDPVAIPDLWGLRDQTALTQAGTINHVGPTALAIRQETQLLTSNHQRVRPPRELAYALALYVYSLAPKPHAPSAATSSAATAQSARGRALFASEGCTTCHSNAAFGGPPVPAERIGTDRALAFGGARGTGTYRPPALLRVADAAPYFHQGAVPTLEDVLSPARLKPTYAGSPVGKGAVAGHVFGTDLPAAERAALASYMRTL